MLSSQMTKYLLFLTFFASGFAQGQVNVDLSDVKKKGNVKATVSKNLLHVSWPLSGKDKATVIINLSDGKPLLKSLQVSTFGKLKEIGVDLNPEFLLTVGK